MTSKQTHNRTREDARNNTLRPFFLRIHPQGKKKQQPTKREDKKTNKESRSKEVKRKANTRAKGQERGQKRGKRDKIEAKHASSL